MAARIRKGDRVVVLSGKDRNTQGPVIEVDHERERVTVRGVNIVTKHTRPSAKLGRGGIVQREAPIHLAKVALLHKGERTRVGFKLVGGKKVRWSKRHNEAVDG